MSKIKIHNQRASILILALWTLALLTTLAVQMGYIIRQKISFVQTLDSRSQLMHATQAGLKMAIAMVEQQRNKTERGLTTVQKVLYLNNPAMLSEIELDGYVAELSYLTKLSLDGPLVKRFGFVPESSKLHLNKATYEQIHTLLLAIEVDEETAENVAWAIFDWKEEGRSELTGFYSDDYYEGLKYPYEPKNAPFETLDELLLVRGMTETLYERLINFATIYGKGSVDINTASAPVLLALGVDERLVEKILQVRMGLDGLEATEDDAIFALPQYIIMGLDEVVEITQMEAQQLDDLINQGKLDTEDVAFFIQSTGISSKTQQKKVISCVFNPQNGRILYWREK